uniref:isoleucine--tRNA ligase n=1 Tax=Blastobotrys adeninivorans TaxID=409370 RepID=A0A060TE49_BLAAD
MAMLGRVSPWKRVGLTSRTVLQRRWNSEDVYKKFGKTLALPKTPYDARPPKESELQDLLQSTGVDLYEWQSKSLPKDTEMVFHDGPPYANGGLHMGHALNKILKDIINRQNLMRGRRVNYIPGWDCHGLPIELAAMANATKKMGKRKASQLSLLERRQLCRDTALQVAEQQKDSFKNLAIMADFDGNSYKTLTPDYVIRQLKVFREMMRHGLISRQNRPVYWSVESQTALAESELQYEMKNSTAIVVKYPLDFKTASDLSKLKGLCELEEPVSVVIWTTTPWTLPANTAIAVGPHIEYVVVKSAHHGNVLVARDLAESVFPGEPIVDSVSLLGSEIADSGIMYKCPLREGDERYRILSGPHVTATSGTGLVHSAPAHGMEDYLMCKQHGISGPSPLNDHGQYTDELAPSLHSLVGLDARSEGQEQIIQTLQERGAVVSLDPNYSHSVPFDWRSKTPVLVRSTPQFFANISNIKSRALTALEDVNFLPDTGRNRLRSFTESRTEWCISRQRVWGVPIPALYRVDNDKVLMDDDSVSHIISILENDPDNGLKKWFDVEDTSVEWVSPSRREKEPGTVYRRGIETMDVWFDSGTSWTMLEARQGHDHLADYYLEGSDQHRGWFQSSLLTKIACSSEADGRPAAPYKNIVTHGMVLDQHGRKMSKSLGNVVLPDDVKNEPKGIKGKDKLGIDGLRMWCAQADYSTDISLSPVTLTQLSAVMKKIRLTFKFLLGNLQGYDGTPVPYQELQAVDKKALHDLYELDTYVKTKYDELSFNRVVQALQNHMNNDLSAFYFDIVKDRVYADSPEGVSRRAVQYVFGEVLKVYFAILSPLIPLTTQKAWAHAPEFIKQGTSSPFMVGWPSVNPDWNNPQLCEEFKAIETLRTGVLDAMEKGRGDKNVRSSLGTEVYVHIPEANGDGMTRLLEKYWSELPAIFITSDVHLGSPAGNQEWIYSSEVETDSSTITVSVVPPTQHKCPRCWQFTAPAVETLCGRCDKVLT